MQALPQLFLSIKKINDGSSKKKLEHLRTERARLEKLFSETLGELDKTTKDSYPAKMVSDIMVFMPKPVWDQFMVYASEEEQSTKNLEFGKISVIMNKVLLDIDKEIEKLINV